MLNRSRRRRLAWIAATYLTSRLFVAIVAIALFVIGVIWLNSGPSSRPPLNANYPPGPRGAFTINNVASLEAIRAAGRQAEVDEIDLGALHWSLVQKANEEGRRTGNIKPVPIDEDFFRVLEEFPKVRILKVRLFDGRSGLQQIGRLKELRYLSIYSSLPIDVSPLKTLSKLDRLDLLADLPMQGIDQLAATDLKRLVIQIGASDSELEAIARLPRLETLVLAFPNADARYALTPAGFAALRECRSLKMLYAGGYNLPAGMLGLGEMARAELPGLDIQPAVVRFRVPPMMYLMPAILISVATSALLVSQFRGPMSRLAPKFAFDHVLVASAWLFLALVAGTCCLTRGNYPVGASACAALSVVCLAICAALTVARQQLFPIAFPRRNWLEIAVQIVSWSEVALLLLPSAAVAMQDSKLWILLAFIAISVTSLLIGWTRIRDLSQWTPTEAIARRWRAPQVQFTRGWLFSSDASEQRIESWPRDPSFWTAWNRIQRWRTANPPFRNLFFGLVMSVAMVGMMYLWPIVLPQLRNAFSLETIRNPLLMMIAWGMMTTGSLRPALAWRIRRLSLGAESLLPGDRRGMQREWAAALLLDLAPPTLLVAAILSVGINLRTDLVMDWSHFLKDFVILVLAIFWITVGLSAILIVVKRDWLRITLVIALAVASIASTVALVAIQLRPPYAPEFLRQVVVAQLWLPAVLCAACAGVMWKRWTKAELDWKV